MRAVELRSGVRATTLNVAGELESAGVIARAVLAVVLVAGCGPATHGPTPTAAATAHKAALIAVAPDAATLDGLIEVLAPVGGDRLAALRFGVDGRIPAWPTAELARHGVRADAPIGIAVTADGVVIRWAAVADAHALATAFDATPGGARWKTEGADLWRFGDDAIAVVVNDRVAALSGGAGSKREQAALELASGELEVTAAPRTGGIAIELDGESLIAAAVSEPGPVLRRIGVDLGRIRVEVSAANAVVGVDVEVAPAAGSLAAELVAGGAGGKMMIPDAPVGFATRISRAHVGDVTTELAAPQQVDVPGYLKAIGRDADKVFDGAIGFAPGTVTVRFVDLDTMVLVSKLIDPLVYDHDYDHGAIAVGGNSADGAGGIGVVLAPGRFASPGEQTAAKPPLPKLEDENTDVPWSMDYRDARTAYETAETKYDVAVAAKKSAADLAWYRWKQTFGVVSIELTPMAGRRGAFHGHGEWHPHDGSIAATVASATAEFDVMAGLDRDIEATYTTALAAHDKALKIRAKDVQAWDNKKH